MDVETRGELHEDGAPDIDVQDDSAFISEISRLLSSTFEAIIRLEDCVYRSHGMDLTNSELNLLSTVGKAMLVAHRALSMSEIADALGIKRPSATAIVKRLEAKGYIARKRSADDARRIDVTLTRKGRMRLPYPCNIQPKDGSRDFPWPVHRGAPCASAGHQPSRTCLYRS
jgi:DNA-binding MarR family transcriptional regulator